MKYSTTSLAYKSAIQAIGNLSMMVETGCNTGSGRFSSSKEWTLDTMKIINQLGYSCIRLNVAPRNGKHGERVIAFEI